MTMAIPARGSKTEPISKGKDDVQCFYCDKKMRKDTLKRHTDTQHKGKAPKFKLVTMGMDALGSFGFSSEKVKSGGKNNPVNIEDVRDGDGETKKDCTDYDDDFGDTDEDIVKPTYKMRQQSDEVMNKPMKRAKDEHTVSIDEKLEIFENRLMACIDVKMEKMVNIVEQLSKNETKIEKHKIEKLKEPSELSDLEISNLIKNSKNIKNLDEVFELKEIGILKETEVKPGIDCYYCSICFEGTIPNFEIKSIGSHFFIKTEDDTGEEFQSRVLRNLKSNVKKNIFLTNYTNRKRRKLNKKTLYLKN